DRVGYSDGFHPDPSSRGGIHPEDCPGGVDLWPSAPDGGGKSLTRKTSAPSGTGQADYGNDPDNWVAAIPSPGQ
ncbi:MAG: hypothetical protein WAV28_17190, partial [Sedimentisphaerales bacterium]